ncbi:MAG: L-seryl-tRNA(Sec) selenium transferase [Chloroflexota bacterium]
MNELRKLPSIDTLLSLDSIAPLIDSHGRDLVVNLARETLDHWRKQILAEAATAPDPETIASQIQAHVQQQVKPTLQPVINATGVIVHTNLGRALLSQRAQQAMQEVANGYNNLEYSLEKGVRDSRYRHAEDLLCQLSGAEAAVVVNNNAAALVLCLSLLAQEKEVLISRSQLVEIGGGFRIPDIMAQSGAKLVEVGATNRSYIRDYEEQLHTVNTGLILRVHSSNFKMVGFTTEPTLAELVKLGDQYGIPVMDDLGSGTLLPTEPYGLAHEPTIQESIAAGVGIITASGDKLLGGPQAGLILGKADIVQKLKKHPLIRALRVDKTTLAALQATLLAYLENKAVEEIPVWQMISAEKAVLNRRARKWQRALANTGLAMQIIDTASTVGGGSLPGQQLPTRALALQVESPNSLAKQLRLTEYPVIARVEDDALVLDPRTVLPSQDNLLIKTLQNVLTC